MINKQLIKQVKKKTNTFIIHQNLNKKKNLIIKLKRNKVNQKKQKVLNINRYKNNNLKKNQKRKLIKILKLKKKYKN